MPDPMKNIQVVDDAANCTFSLFQVNEREFAVLFPAPGQDVQFAEDLGPDAKSILAKVWQRPIRKADARGIHGTLFFGLPRYREIFPGKREDSVNPMAINEAQRRLFARRF
jgi:hypothetical protein